MNNPRLSVIMPALNEGALIYDNLLETVSCLEALGVSFEIILVDDGSSDDTLAEAQRAASRDGRIIVTANYHNLGKGWAIKTGFKRARGEVVAFLDADLDVHPGQIGIMLEKLESGICDVVIGSKFHPDSRLEYPWSRRIFSLFYFLFIKLLFGLPLKDTQTGIKLFSKEVLDRVFPHVLVKMFAFDIEILSIAHRDGFKIAEVPVIVRFKRGQVWGRISFRDIVHIFIDTLAVYYRLNILNYYARELPVLESCPMVSIIIAVGSYNENLAESINACLRLDYPRFEILVMPDEPFACSGDERVKVIPTGKRNPSHKRDLAGREAGGEILAFLDDDAYPVVDWLTNAVRNFSMPEVAAVGGPALTPPTDNLRQQASGEIYSSKLVGGSYTYRYVQGRFRQVEDYPTCNLLVRKDVFDKVGGFDTEYWPGEDTIFCLKIIRDLELEIVYEPDAIVFHHRRELYRGHLKQIKSYAQHRGFFVKRFPETSFLLVYFLPSILILALALGWAAAFVWAPLGIIYQVGVLAYIVSALLTAALSLHPRRIWLVFSGIVLSHLTYGVYFIKGLLSAGLDENE